MSSVRVNEILKDDSLEDFLFLDEDGDLEIDLPNSTNQDTKTVSKRIPKLFSALCDIVEEHGLVASIPFSAVAATAVGAITGSLLGGPPGLAVGLITGAVIAYRTSPKRSKSPKSEPAKSSIRQIFNQMTLQQKKELIKELLSCLKQSNVRSLIFELVKNETIRKMALEILSGFLMKKMGVSLVKPK